MGSPETGLPVVVRTISGMVKIVIVFSPILCPIHIEIGSFIHFSIFSSRMNRETSLITVFPDYQNTAHIHGWKASQIVRQPVPGILNLPFADNTMRLQIHFIEHAESRGPDGMAETLESPVGLAGDLPVLS